MASARVLNRLADQNLILAPTSSRCPPAAGAEVEHNRSFIVEARVAGSMEVQALAFGARQALASAALKAPASAALEAPAS